MAGRWGDPSAFRADPDAAPAAHPSRRQTVALLAVLALVAGAVAVASYLIRPERARAFDLFHGSVFLSDQNGPVAVDLASGKPTLQLRGADQQVSLADQQTLGIVPLIDHTLLLNQSTGEFNMVDNSGFVVKHDGGGVPLVHRPAGSTAVGIAAASGEAYIERTGPTGGTDVYLVSQSTVESALNATGNVRARASGSMPERATTDPGGAASANGDLWLLVGGTDGGRRIVRQLHVPANSSAGATLSQSDVGVVNGAAAIGTATVGTADSSTEVVGVASESGIDVYTPGQAKPRSAAYRPPPGTDTVLPVSNGQGRLAFLLHAAQGWYIVSVDADGSHLRPPTQLNVVPSSASLAAPANSNGRMYTVDRTGGQLYEIDYDGTARLLPGRPIYPFERGEPSDFGDADVLARGPRVIVNSADHLDALMIFTDGSRAPRTIVKTAAVAVLASGGAEALTKSTVPAGQIGKPKQGQPKPVAGQPINTKIDCKTAKQRPHVPVITSAVPGSRSVTLAWTYPILSPQDCYPSTYLVSVKLISNDAPPAPKPVPVQSQTGVTIGGLFPSTQYQLTVGAYIHDQGTESASVRITTGVEGPAAPTDLQVGADSSGNWKLAWDSCGTVSNGCVPAQSWTVNASFCDGRGVSGTPPPITVTGDPTSRRQPPTIYRGNDDLLGRGLRFTVLGVGDQGQAGAPSSASACVYSWTPPVAADISLQASSPPDTAGSGDTTTTTATVRFAHGQVHDLGGVGGTLTYQLLSGGTVVDRVGPTTDSTATLHGIRAAQRYQVRVLASPPRHHDVVTPIGPVDVVPAVAKWPALTLDQPTVSAPAGMSGTLHLSFSFPAGTDTRGETFQLVNSQLTCGDGNAVMPLEAADVAPGDDMTFPVDRAVYRNSCTVTIQLSQDPRTVTDPPLYGAGLSAAQTSQPFDIPPPSITSTKNDFDAKWGSSETDPTIVVSYHGEDDLSGARNWRIFVTNDGGATDCNRIGNPVTQQPPVIIDVLRSCVASGGKFQVIIDYDYFLLSHAHFVVDLSGIAPAPVDLSKIDFSASWDTFPQPGTDIVLDFTYSGGDLSDLASLDWSEIVTSSGTPAVVCAEDTQNPGSQTVRLKQVLLACPDTPDSNGNPPVYTVQIHVEDHVYGQPARDWSHNVTNQPPAQ
jgi:hypothetical protein